MLYNVQISTNNEKIILKSVALTITLARQEHQEGLIMTARKPRGPKHDSQEHQEGLIMTASEQSALYR
jgi:hypothetical protein